MNMVAKYGQKLDICHGRCHDPRPSSYSVDSVGLQAIFYTRYVVRYIADFCCPMVQIMHDIS